jgi:4-hydroxybenzoate polyprenyltransferase
VLIIKALRIEQWIKNLIIFFPILFIGQYNLEKVLLLSKVFFGFSLMVSATYIINDLVDIESDKKHPSKKHRPVASSNIDSKIWLLISASLFLIGSFILIIINREVYLYSIIYISLSISYTFKLKFLKFLDLTTITVLFLLRIYIGSVVFQIPLSGELVFFVLFMSLGIISSKKYSILVRTDIESSKVKTFLEETYSKNILALTSKGSFSFALFTYLYWVLKSENSVLLNYNILLHIIGIFFLGIFNFLYYKEMKIGNTEDIFQAIKNNYSLLIALFLFTFFLILGVV